MNCMNRMMIWCVDTADMCFDHPLLGALLRLHSACGPSYGLIILGTPFSSKESVRSILSPAALRSSPPFLFRH